MSLDTGTCRKHDFNAKSPNNWTKIWIQHESDAVNGKEEGESCCRSLCVASQMRPTELVIRINGLKFVKF